MSNEFKVGDQVQIIGEWDNWSAEYKDHPTVGKRGIITGIFRSCLNKITYEVKLHADNEVWIYTYSSLELLKSKDLVLDTISDLLEVIKEATNRLEEGKATLNKLTKEVRRWKDD